MSDAMDRERRILQLYDPEKQRQFAHFTAQDRLEWLAAINELYWQARLKAERKTPDSET